MKKFFLVFVAVLFSISSAYAAETKVSTPSVKAYYFTDDSTWGSDRYVVVDGVAYKTSDWTMLPSDFENVMKSNPKASEYARIAHDSMVKGNWIFWGLLGGYFAYGSTTPSPHYNSSVGAVILLSAIFGGGYYFNKAQNHMWKAINAYNGVDVERLPVKSGFYIQPTNDGLVTQYNLSF